jgi:hypothetical protein
MNNAQKNTNKNRKKSPVYNSIPFVSGWVTAVTDPHPVGKRQQKYGKKANFLLSHEVGTNSGTDTCPLMVPINQ